MPFWLVCMEIYGMDFLTSSFVIYISNLHHEHQLESPDCTLYGSEYGEFIEEYLQSIIGDILCVFYYNSYVAILFE
jgi:hypothetical protein